MGNLLATLRAAWPMLWPAIKSGQLFAPHCNLTEAPSCVHCEPEVRIPMPDGTYLTSTVYSRRRGTATSTTALPVIMCAHPYDARITPALNATPLGGPPFQFRVIPQPRPQPRFSRLTSWEAPDPAFWTQHGYTVVNVNLPGFASSDGPPSLFTPHQTACFFDAIEWTADQPWCDGNIGLSGVSYLAMTQYHVAACRAYGGRAPRGLKAISPWEGLPDFYGDLACVGGVDEIGFLHFWWHTEVKRTVRDGAQSFMEVEGGRPVDFIRQHRLRDDKFWQMRMPLLECIQVPMLLCASFSDHQLHSMGSFRAFERIGSRQKWLYTHRGGKWSTYYEPEVQRLTLDFMDCFLKGVSNQFSEGGGLPPVRLETRVSRDEIKLERWETSWPIAGTQYQQLHLTTCGLSTRRPSAVRTIGYEASGVRAGHASFDYVFDDAVEICGYMAAVLWLSVRGACDAVLCLTVDKVDTQGRRVPFNGTVGILHDAMTRGYIRASRRRLDTSRSRVFHPVFDGASEDALVDNGPPVRLQVALCPSSTFFEKGEGVRLTVSPTERVGAPIFQKDTGVNAGTHVLHVGGEFDSHLLLPIVPGS